MAAQISSCDAILATMEDMLGKFQSDLGNISSEIRALQEQSQSMSVRLRNRKAAESRLGTFLDNLALPAIPHRWRLACTPRRWLCGTLCCPAVAWRLHIHDLTHVWDVTTPHSSVWTAWHSGHPSLAASFLRPGRWLCCEGSSPCHSLAVSAQPLTQTGGAVQP